MKEFFNTRPRAAGKIYKKSYYSSRDGDTKTAAETVLSLIPVELIKHRTILDLGCGAGTWASVALNSGASSAVCVDGPWVDRRVLEISPVDFVSADLSVGNPEIGNDYYDLCIWLENAEHLSEPRGKELVSWVVRHASWILFSAAIPNQGGTGHLNEQWQSYWAELFFAHGLIPFDFIRPHIWTDDNLPFWYRQNIILYGREDYAPPVIRPYKQTKLRALDCVHYKKWDGFWKKPGFRTSLKFCARSMLKIVGKLKRGFSLRNKNGA